MSNYIKHLFFGAFLLLQIAVNAQQMWPGDANNNGIVNGSDFIYYGLAYGSSGPERPGATSNWVPQAIDPWAQFFPNGVNYAFADFDGDGEVDNSDQSKFEANWGLTHGAVTPDGYTTGTNGAPVAIELVPSVLQTGPGGTINIDVRLGSAASPAQDVYGIAFKFKYSNNLVNNNGSDIDFEELPGSWIGADGEFRKFMQKDEPSGRAETGVTRTNQQTATGGGSIGNFVIVIEEIIVGLTRDTFRIEIDSIVLYDNVLGAYAVQADSVAVEVVAPEILLSEQTIADIKGRIVPNPVKRSAIIELSEALEHYELTDMQGKKISLGPIINLSTNRYMFNTSGLLPGIYQFSGYTRRGIWEKLICVLPE